MIDQLGGPNTYNQFPTGWAMAFNTPFTMWKCYEFNGGTCDPSIIAWPSVLGAAASRATSTTTRSTWYRRSLSCYPAADVPEAQAVDIRKPLLVHRRPGSSGCGRLLS